MNRLFDGISGSISRDEAYVQEEDVELINNLPNPPPVPVTPDDIYVRRCRLTGDGINCHFGRFHTEDLEMLLEKAQGVSCLIGHRKDTAGIARFFGGTIRKHKARDYDSGEITEMNFIVPKIYWMKSHSKANDLRINIDGGVYHQASISWYFEKPVCGICGRDIRTCDHVPGRRYDGWLCFFWYEGIGDVLEGSIVYAGGHPGTGFELNGACAPYNVAQKEVFKIDNSGRISKEDILPYLQNIDRGAVYLVGDIAEQGWTDTSIDVLPDPSNAGRVGTLLPPYLCGRLSLHRTFSPPGACVKIGCDSVLEIEEIPAVSECPDVETEAQYDRETGLKHAGESGNAGGAFTVYGELADGRTKLHFTAGASILHADIRMEDIEKLNRGLWCPVEVEAGPHPDAEAGQVMDGGCCALLEDGEDRICAACAGDMFHGIYMFRRIVTEGRDAWYVYKR